MLRKKEEANALLDEALTLIRELLEWEPDDLPEGDVPEIFSEAREFLSRSDVK